MPYGVPSLWFKIAALVLLAAVVVALSHYHSPINEAPTVTAKTRALAKPSDTPEELLRTHHSQAVAQEKRNSETCKTFRTWLMDGSRLRY